MPDPIYSRADEYRRRGIEAQRRAAQLNDLSIKQTFTDIANQWFALAEQVEWLESRRSALDQRAAE
jgi:hypothetical protein